MIKSKIKSKSDKINFSRVKNEKELTNEEQGKNDELDIYDKNNEKKILELYQDFVEQQLENQRREQLKENGSRLLNNLSNDRCPI